jgi:hypothetical protein
VITIVTHAPQCLWTVSRLPIAAHIATDMQSPTSSADAPDIPDGPDDALDEEEAWIEVDDVKEDGAAEAEGPDEGANGGDDGAGGADDVQEAMDELATFVDHVMGVVSVHPFLKFKRALYALNMMKRMVRAGQTRARARGGRRSCQAASRLTDGFTGSVQARRGRALRRLFRLCGGWWQALGLRASTRRTTTHNACVAGQAVAQGAGTGQVPALESLACISPPPLC